MKTMQMTLPKDLKSWYALSCPTKGVRFDARTLAFLDRNGDGRIRTDEVLAALDYLAGKNVSIESLAHPDAEDEKRLQDIRARQETLAQAEPSELERAALEAWTRAGAEPSVAICGAATERALAALAAVEPLVDAFFTPPDDMPLVTEEPDPILPLESHINPRHQEAMLEFAAQCVKPVLGERAQLTRLEWKHVKAAFQPYRNWKASRPLVNAESRAVLEDEERLLCYKLHLGEFLANYVTMDRLYAEGEQAIFQTGVLRIDGRELSLCFHVENEAAHAALVEKSNCCVIYLKLVRADIPDERALCAVVTAGTVNGLYAGRNGVFYDRDGKNWEATVTKVVEAQVSLVEAFWAPWRTLGESVSEIVRKFLSDWNSKATGEAKKAISAPQGGGAALASSVAAVGIGVGMVGAAAASIMAAVSRMSPLQIAGALAALLFIVSLPSTILAWFKLRRRDLGVILNASGWAINRRMRLSMAQACRFTKCR